MAMTYSTRPSDFHNAIPYSPVRHPAARRRGIWRIVFDAIMGAHQRDAQREIDRFVARSGGKFSDSLEREIGERLSRSDWNVGR
jgi:hypothetical protein